MTATGDEYTAAILIIGDEILSGRTTDQNTPWLAERLDTHGIKLCEVRVIPDDTDAIIHAVNVLRPKYDYLVTTGGIGPTHDDITADSMAKAFGVPLYEDPEARKVLEEHYGETDLNEARLKMAIVPKGSTLIDNPVSAAPGFIMENVYVLAGVPRIMQGMVDTFIHDLAGGNPMQSNTVTCTLGESQIAKELGDIQNEYPDVSIGSYPQYRRGVLGLSIVLRSANLELLDDATQKVIATVEELGGSANTVNVRQASG